MPAVEIKPDVYWIGVNDRTTDLFEGLWPITKEGVSYNSYLINDEKHHRAIEMESNGYTGICRMPGGRRSQKGKGIWRTAC